MKKQAKRGDGGGLAGGAAEAPKRARAPAPRKAPGARNGGGADKKKVKEVAFYLDGETWQDMRIACIRADMSMQRWLTETVKERLAAE